nr:hypothetical protein CFP56_10336 [Quercus suber]
MYFYAVTSSVSSHNRPVARQTSCSVLACSLVDQSSRDWDCGLGKHLSIILARFRCLQTSVEHGILLAQSRYATCSHA